MLKIKKKLKLVEKIESDRSNKFGSSSWLSASDPFNNINHSRVIDYLSTNYEFQSKNLNTFEYRLRLRRQMWGYQYATRFISTSDNTLYYRPFFIILNGEIEKNIKDKISVCKNQVITRF